MNDQAHIRVTARPGKPASAILIAVGIVFFVFGTVLTGVADTEGEPELRLLVWLFRIVWWVVCVGMIVFGILGLKGKSPAMVEFDVDSSWPENDAARHMREQAANSSNLPSSDQ